MRRLDGAACTAVVGAEVEGRGGGSHRIDTQSSCESVDLCGLTVAKHEKRLSLPFTAKCFWRLNAHCTEVKVQILVYKNDLTH